MLTGSGHIAGVVNPPARENTSTGPAERRRVAGGLAEGRREEHPGSWWDDWQAWLEALDDTRIKKKRRPGGGKLKPLGGRARLLCHGRAPDASAHSPVAGRHVLEKPRSRRNWHPETNLPKLPNRPRLPRRVAGATIGSGSYARDSNVIALNRRAPRGHRPHSSAAPFRPRRSSLTPPRRRSPPRSSRAATSRRPTIRPRWTASNIVIEDFKITRKAENDTVTFDEVVIDQPDRQRQRRLPESRDHLHRRDARRRCERHRSATRRSPMSRSSTPRKDTGGGLSGEHPLPDRRGERSSDHAEGQAGRRSRVDRIYVESGNVVDNVPQDSKGSVEGITLPVRCLPPMPPSSPTRSATTSSCST